MTTLTTPFALPRDRTETWLLSEPSDSYWPLMGDVATVRAGVPEALIQWRKARGEAPPEPN